MQKLSKSVSIFQKLLQKVYCHVFMPHSVYVCSLYIIVVITWLVSQFVGILQCVR